MRKYIDKTGSRFGKILVVKHIGIINGIRKYECKCDCGNIKIFSAGNLGKAKISSCGCNGVKMATISKIKHGKSGTRIFKIWANMIERCESIKKDNYKYYGGRGIKVCERWHKFINFYEDMKEGYADNLQLERNDNDGDYEKCNCSWVTHKNQCRNRRSSVYLEFGGHRLSEVEWGEKIGIKSSVISKRIKRGWAVEKILTTPVRKTYNGKYYY